MHQGEPQGLDAATGHSSPTQTGLEFSCQPLPWKGQVHSLEAFCPSSPSHLVCPQLGWLPWNVKEAYNPAFELTVLQGRQDFCT